MQLLVQFVMFSLLLNEEIELLSVAPKKIWTVLTVIDDLLRRYRGIARPNSSSLEALGLCGLRENEEKGVELK
jgi:hypothetical protein